MRSMYGIALPETNSNFAPENLEYPWKFGDSGFGECIFFSGPNS